MLLMAAILLPGTFLSTNVASTAGSAVEADSLEDNMTASGFVGLNEAGCGGLFLSKSID